MAGDNWREDILPAIERSVYRDLLPRRGGGSRGGRVESLQFTNGATLKFMSGGGGDKSRDGFTSRVVVITETDGMDQLAEELKQRHGSKVEPITMTAPVKESLASLILSLFQRGHVRMPDHRPLIDDLHSMQRSVTLAGNVRYAAPREAGSHADRWTALALALHAAGTAPVCKPQPVYIMYG